MKTISVVGEWDQDCVPAGEASERGLLLTVTAECDETQAVEREPINLALVIDRSGSMSGGKLVAAKMAACAIVDSLRDDDAFSLVTFESEVEVSFPAAFMTAEAKENARCIIERLQTAGTTNLGGGWFKGAQCVSGMLDEGFKRGHVVVLSDGMANRGVTDPAELSMHARELAERGVTTSAIGVGDGYSPIQLDALAEGGCGRLHDAEDPEELAVVAVAEVGDLMSESLRDVRITISLPEGVEGEVVGNFRAVSSFDDISVRIGALLANQAKRIPVVVSCSDSFEPGQKLAFSVCVDSAGELVEPQALKTSLTVLPASEVGSMRDGAIVEQIVNMWTSWVVFGAMNRNERGDYSDARSTIADVRDRILGFAIGTASYETANTTIGEAIDRVSRRWEGRSKREAMIRSKKVASSVRDYRAGKSADSWARELRR